MIVFSPITVLKTLYFPRPDTGLPTLTGLKLVCRGESAQRGGLKLNGIAISPGLMGESRSKSQ